MLTLFRALPRLARLLTVVGVLTALSGSVWGVYAYVHHQGYVDGRADADAACAKRMHDMEEANRKAADEAQKVADELAAQLEIKEAQIDDYVKALDLAADAGPDAAGQCLDADSVRRLNAIQ